VIAMTPAELAKSLAEILSLDVAKIDLGKSFVDNGGFSLAAVRWIDSFYGLSGVVLNFFDVMGAEPLQALLDNAVNPGSDEAPAPSDVEEGLL
jgi:hypothetical protein